MNDEFTFKGPLFRTDEAAAYLNYRGKHTLRSLYRFLEKYGVPRLYRSHTILIRKADLDKALGATQRRAS